MKIAGSRSKWSESGGKRSAPPRSAFPVPRSPFRPSRPYVIINMAMTADGKIATANSAITSFGSRKDQNHLLELRATADAVLSGATTAGGPHITMGSGPPRFRRKRLSRGLTEFPLRIVVSGSGRLSPRASLFQHRFSPIIVLCSRQASSRRLQALREVSDMVAVFGENKVDLPAALRWLRKRWKVRRLVCEGGGELNDAMFRSGLVDELHLTICPRIFGGRTAPTIAEGSGVARLAAAARLELRSSRVEEDEMFLVYQPAGAPRSSSRVSTQRAISQRTSESRLR